ncbi:hypothetical protein SRABI106_04604 [Rahnella aquatilis]|nr:hypothetical protein SRABI106_04604 [Rahnella aquatilis]
MQVDQITGNQFFIGIIKCVQALIQDPGGQTVVFRKREPLLIRIMNEIAISDFFAQIEISEEIVSRQALKIFTQSRSQCGFFAGAFTVGEAQRAVAIANVH